jgi:hypothetical protein
VDARNLVRGTASAVAIACVYFAHWFLTYYAAVALALGDNPDFQCWATPVTSGPDAGYCEAAWGGWPPVMYLPELALAAAAIAGLVARSFRVWKWSLCGAALSLVVVGTVVSATHLSVLNQMPVFWPKP